MGGGTGNRTAKGNHYCLQTKTKRDKSKVPFKTKGIKGEQVGPKKSLFGNTGLFLVRSIFG